MAQSQDSKATSGNDEESAGQVEEVVVTGSRIRRNEFTSSQPIQVITAEQASLEGTVDTAELLQSSTVANTATQINNFFTGYVVTGGAGVNTVSLRGLGANRTLVLVNGRRAGPAGVGGTVGPADLNTIPSSQIERVEILTDGASSIYGSDAVAGVVNIITKTNQDGGTFEVFASQPFESGGEEYRINGSKGWSYDRGYLTIGADYYERKELTFGDREEFSCPQDQVYYDENLTIRADVVDPATGDYKCISSVNGIIRNYFVQNGAYRTIDYSPNTSATQGGGVLGCDLDGYQHVNGGYASTPIAGVTTNCAVASQSADVRRAYYENYNLHSDRYDSRTAISPVTRASFSAFGGFDLTPSIEIFGEFQYNQRKSEQHSWRQLFPTVYNAHPDFPLGFGTYSLPIILLNTDYDQTVDYYRGVGGARGRLDIGRGYDWEITAQYSRSEGTYGNNFFYADRVYATSGYSPTYGFASGSNLTEFQNTGCVSAWLTTATACPTGGVNYFSTAALLDGQLTAEEAEFIIGYEQGTTLYEHQYVEGVISGDLFDLPAGPLGAALGFQLRKESIDDQPGEQAQAQNLWGQTASGRTKGDDTIKEVFGELEIPVLRNIPLIDSLSFNVSGRYSDYDSYGENSTYKLGLNWAITPEYRIRASKGTSFRAPALYELYLANQTSFLGQTSIDPCINWGESTNVDLRANCAADGIPEDYNAGGSSSATIIAGGGKGILEPETADSLSVGFIWTPQFADVSVALDYYKIEVHNQVQQFGAANILSSCYYSNNFENEALCSLFTRGEAGSTREYQVLTVQNSYVNVAEQMSEGLDLNARYRREFAVGDLTLQAKASYILDWTSQLRGEDEPESLLEEIGYPDWTANVSARFDKGDWTIYWNADIVPEVDNDRFYTSNSALYLGETVYYDRTAEFYMTHSISVRKRLDDVTIQVGINNIFDENAPLVSTGASRVGNVPLTSQYDYVGRRAFVSFSKTW